MTDDELVTVHLNQPSFQGFIVDVVTDGPDVPILPKAKPKFVKTSRSDPHTICAKSFVPLRRKMDNVLSAVDTGNGRVINQPPSLLEPVIRYAFKQEGKTLKLDIIVLIMTPFLSHIVASTTALERVSKFVRASSRSKPFGASVMGS